MDYVATYYLISGQHFQNGSYVIKIHLLLENLTG